MRKHELPSIELLHELLECDAVNGLLFWRERGPHLFPESNWFKDNGCKAWNARYSGQPALSYKNPKGYCGGKIFNQFLLAHRVIWAMHYGEWPGGQIDHKNHDRTDNRISNLRVVTNQGNGKNRSLQKNNTSGFTGVQWIKSSGKWDARITVDGVQKFLGSFVKKQDAITARQAANKKYKYHTNHGS